MDIHGIGVMHSDAIEQSFQKEIFLRKLLRQYPWWYRGHLLLATELLAQRLPYKSYICLLAIESQLIKEVLPLKSRILLALGKAEESLCAFKGYAPNFESLVSGELEHYVAILLLLDDKEQLRDLLSKIPDAKKTAPIQTIESYLRLPTA